MRGLIDRLRQLLAGAPNAIALTTALRGTIATILPLLLLPRLGLSELAYPAVLGALATSMVDVGGPYRARLVAMLLQAVGGPLLLLLGSTAVEHWWLAAPVMAVIGVVSGLIRASGPGGASLGINLAVAFLVGLQVGAAAGRDLDWPLGYGIGGFWTIAVCLFFWRLRPYRRLDQEVAAAWEAVAALIATVATADEPSVVARRRREQRIDTQQATARDAIARARDTLGELRAQTAGPDAIIPQLLVLLNAAQRIEAAVATLAALPATPHPARHDAAAELEQAVRGIARVLLSGGGTVPLATLRRQLAVARADQAASGDLLAWAQMMRHLDNAEEALGLLFGARARLIDLLRLPLSHRRPKGAVIAAIRAHMTPQSAIFRHAMRVAAVTALDTTAIAYYALPHGIWLPMTSLVILQPDYGATVTRAVERSLGTIAGAALAGLLLALLHRTAAYDVALGLLLFATFLLIRRRYGYAITFLTPLIILLIGMSSADPWIDLAERVAYTIAGAAVALGAGYLLWPRWERAQLRDRLADAIRADAALLDASLAGLAMPAPDTLPELRLKAELTVANADAGYQRMLGEPRHRSAPIAASFALLVYLRRLCRHATALSDQPSAAAPGAPLDVLRQLLRAALDDAADALGAGRAPAPRPRVDTPLAELVAALTQNGSEPGEVSAGLLGRLVSDTTGLIGAVTAAQLRDGHGGAIGR